MSGATLALTIAATFLVAAIAALGGVAILAYLGQVVANEVHQHTKRKRAAGGDQ